MAAAPATMGPHNSGGTDLEMSTSDVSLEDIHKKRASSQTVPVARRISHDVQESNGKRTNSDSMVNDLAKQCVKDYSLYIKIIEARNLERKQTHTGILGKTSDLLKDLASPNLLNVDTINVDPYCVVECEGRSFRTRTVFKRFNPYWDEEVTFDISDPITAKFSTTIYHANRYSGDKPIGRVTIPLRRLLRTESRAVHERWFTLLHPQNRNPCGEVRLSLTLSEDFILPPASYAGLLSVLVDDSQLTLVNFMAVMGKGDIDDLAKMFLDLFAARRKGMSLLKRATDREISSTNSAGVIFRGNTLATKLVDVYMKRAGHEYLLETLGGVLKEIINYRKNCEINPDKLERPSDASKNAKRLLRFVQKVTDKIFASPNRCPMGLRVICRHIRKQVVQHFPENMLIPYTAVTGFIFLRFFCPALLSPRLYGLTIDQPSLATTRTLTYISKVLQNLANQVEFTGEKEHYMGFMNKFVAPNMERMRNFIDELVRVPELTDKEQEMLVTVSEDVNLYKSLASLHRKLRNYAPLLEGTDGAVDLASSGNNLLASSAGVAMPPTKKQRLQMSLLRPAFSQQLISVLNKLEPMYKQFAEYVAAEARERLCNRRSNSLGRRGSAPAAAESRVRISKEDCEDSRDISADAAL